MELNYEDVRYRMRAVPRGAHADTPSVPPADFAWTDRHATPSSLTDGGLRAHRWAIVLGAVAIPTFWVLDRLQGLVYNDRLAYRLALPSTQRGPYASSSASVSRPTALAAVRLHDGLEKPYDRT